MVFVAKVDLKIFGILNELCNQSPGFTIVKANSKRLDNFDLKAKRDLLSALLFVAKVFPPTV